MRKCYENHFEPMLIKAMESTCSNFRYMDAGARKKVGGLSFYGPGKLYGFEWSPRDELKFVVTFRVPSGKDDFEASCEWTESGKIVKNQTLLDAGLFELGVLRLPYARTLMQSLSAAVDPPERRAIRWQFWLPSSDINDTDAWFKEFMEDGLRELSDEEARRRVEVAVRTAAADVARCGLPWFDSKLKVYQSER